MPNKRPQVNIVFSVSDTYIPMLSVALLSLAEHSNLQKTYNIFILKNGNLQYCSQQLSYLKKYNHLNITLINLENYKELWNNQQFYTYGYVSEETYYRIFLPQILPNLKKILYCDVDIVFCSDVSELYDINLNNKILAAASNISAIYNYSINNTLPNGEKYKPYFEKILKLKNPKNYFQAGICLFNLEKMRTTNFTAKCLSKLAEIKTPVFFDQCILNTVCEGDVKNIPLSWNHVWYFFDYQFLEQGISQSLYREYDESRKSPKIIHYAGPKPFTDRHRPLAGEFWKYAIQTPQFEYFLKQAFGEETKKEIIPNDLFKNITIVPAFKKQISILLSSSNNYAPYLGITLYSLFQNMDITRNYDILILETQINDTNKSKILEIAKPYKNCKVRFINISHELEAYNYLFYVFPPLSQETYYRLFIDKLFTQYDKMIYIDADTLITSDLTELYDLNIGNNWIAASKDYILQSRAKNNITITGINLQYYIKNVLYMDYNKYVQCGILLFNLKELRKINFSQKSITMLQYLRNPRFVDQDVINKVCEDHIYYLSPKYNYLVFYQRKELNTIDEEFYNEISEAANDIKIYHMPGGKPDMFPETSFATLYFQYARQTPFYENILKNMAFNMSHDVKIITDNIKRELATIHFPNINQQFLITHEMVQSLFINQHKWLFIIKKLYYKIKMKISFSKKTRQKYKNKYNKLKAALKRSKKYNKALLSL